MIRAALLAVLALGAAAPLAAKDVKLSQFRKLESLAADGFETIPAQGGGAVFGMRKDADIYLCFLNDEPALQAERQRVISGYSGGDSDNRTLPNIPVVCVKTE